MKLNLNDKKVFITGASKGLGFEIAKAFVKEGSIVTMCARDRVALEKAKNSINNSDGQVFAHSMDAANYQAVSKGIEKAVDMMGSLDILINNVGSTDKFASFFDLEEEDWMHTYRTNVLSIVNTVKIAYQFLTKSKNPRIINISSLTGLEPGRFSPHYSTSKAAVINLSKHLSNILVSDNILVNCVVPGPFESDAWNRNIQRVANQQNISFLEAEKIENELAISSIPINRIGKPNDIVPVILLLASNRSSWITGSCFVIDGGKIKSMS